MWPFKKVKLEGSSCSFCGKPQKDVKKLIAGPPGLFICDQCVALCSDILAQQDEESGS